MRQSRFESQALVRSATVEQAILMESELAVYPYTGGNNFVQHCSAGDGIGLGDNALAIRVDPSLRTGSTAASETFGNPCLLDPKEEAFRTFQIANLEVWTLTPHDTVKEAEQTELKAFFQQRQREEHKNRLDLFGILVGGPKRK
jgi:TLD